MDSWEIFEINDFTDSSDFEKFVSFLGKCFKEWARDFQEYNSIYFLDNPECQWYKREQELNFCEGQYILTLHTSRRENLKSEFGLQISHTHYLANWFDCKDFIVLKKLSPKTNGDIHKKYPEKQFISNIPLSANQTYTLLSALSLAIQNQKTEQTQKNVMTEVNENDENSFLFPETPFFVCINESANLYEGFSLIKTSIGLKKQDTIVWYRANYRMIYFTQPLSGLAYYDYLVDLYDNLSSHTSNTEQAKSLKQEIIEASPVKLCFTFLAQPLNRGKGFHWSFQNTYSTNSISSISNTPGWTLGTQRHPLEKLEISICFETQTFDETGKLLRENEIEGCNILNFEENLQKVYTCTLTGQPTQLTLNDCSLTCKMMRLIELVPTYEFGYSADPQEPFLDPNYYMKGDNFEINSPSSNLALQGEGEDLQKVLERLIEKNSTKGKSVSTDGSSNKNFRSRAAIPDAIMDEIFWFIFPDSIPKPTPKLKISPLINTYINEIPLGRKLKLGPESGLVDRVAHVIYYLTNGIATPKFENEVLGGDTKVPTRDGTQRLDQDGEAMRRLKEFWKEFVLELRYRWDSTIPLPLLEEGKPNFHYDLIYQKLQMLNCCIALKQKRNRSKPSPSKSDEELFYECRSSPCHELSPTLTSFPTPEGRSHALGENVKLLNQTDLLYVPLTQEAPFMTEDQMELHLKVLTDTDAPNGVGGSLGTKRRAELQSCTLKSDMRAFKAANPSSGDDIRNFLRWYSPADLIWEEGDRDASQCKLSQRMLTGRSSSACKDMDPQSSADPSSADCSQNIWTRLWESETPAAPISRQKSLFDETLQGEKVLHHLAHLSFRQLICDLVLPYTLRYALKLQTQLIKENTTSEKSHELELEKIAQKLLNSLGNWLSGHGGYSHHFIEDPLLIYQNRIIPQLQEFETTWAGLVFSHNLVQRYFPKTSRDVRTSVSTKLLRDKFISFKVGHEDSPLFNEIINSGCNFLGPSNLKLLIEPEDLSQYSTCRDFKCYPIYEKSLVIGLLTKEYKITRSKNMSIISNTSKNPLKGSSTTLKLYASVGKNEFRVAKIDV